MPPREIEVYESAFAEGWAAEPILTVSQWADAHRMLSSKASSEAGHWRTDRTPYLREIMDSLSAVDPVQRVVFMKGAQIGATECGNNWIGYIIHHAPGPALMIQPTMELAKRVSKQRLAPMIEATTVLSERVSEPRSRDSGNTTFVKEFPGGLLILTGSNSGAGLRSMPIRFLFCDEIDEYPGDVDGQGDPISLAEKRTATFARRKIFLVSTPTIMDFSRIEREFKRSDQRRYYVPCPGCGNYDWIRWENIHWDEGVPESVMLACAECGELIPEGRKTEMLARGEWRPTAVGDARTRGYHLSGLYSPVGWNSWEAIIREFISAKDDPFKLKTWINTILGETWEERGETVNDSVLFARREKYSAEVPPGALVLTAGVDIQDDRIELEIVGWGPGEESWAVDYRVLYGSPGEQPVWTALSDFFEESYENELKEKMRVSAACVDSGGHFTQNVYHFCRGRRARRIFAIKGMSGVGRPIVSSPMHRRSGRNRRPVDLFMVGVDEAKGLLYSRLRLKEPGPGYCHFPIRPEFSEEYFSQLAAEKIMTRYSKGFPRREWVKTRPRNEALDCRIYALAALQLLNPTWPALVRRAAKRAAQTMEQPKPEVPRLPPRRPLRRGWINAWR